MNKRKRGRKKEQEELVKQIELEKSELEKRNKKIEEKCKQEN